MADTPPDSRLPAGPGIRRCDILIPRMDSMIGADKFKTACDLPYAHHGPHAFTYPAEDNLLRHQQPQRWEWADDWDCDCCEPEEEDRCFTFGKIAPSSPPET